MCKGLPAYLLPSPSRSSHQSPTNKATESVDRQEARPSPAHTKFHSLAHACSLTCTCRHINLTHLHMQTHQSHSLAHADTAISLTCAQSHLNFTDSRTETTNKESTIPKFPATLRYTQIYHHEHPRYLHFPSFASTKQRASMLSCEDIIKIVPSICPTIQCASMLSHY